MEAVTAGGAQGEQSRPGDDGQVQQSSVREICGNGARPKPARESRSGSGEGEQGQSPVIAVMTIINTEEGNQSRGWSPGDEIHGQHRSMGSWGLALPHWVRHRLMAQGCEEAPGAVGSVDRHWWGWSSSSRTVTGRWFQ